MAEDSRPNKKYILSNREGSVYSNGDEQLTFYYNREKRLEKAPEAVQNLYVNKKHSRFNLLGPLIADKPRAFIFFTIVIMCVVIVILGILGRMGKSYSLDGNIIEITGTRFEDTTIVILKKSHKKNANSFYTGPVDIAVSPVIDAGSLLNENFPIFYHRIFFTHEANEEYRFAVPYDSPELLLVLQTERSSLQLKFSSK